MVPVANSHVNNVGVGAFTYTTTFDPTNHQRLTFRQDVQTLADDVVANVVLNGTRLSNASNGFGTPGGFQILGGSGLLLPGENTIAITVNNVIVSPTGLSVRSAFASVTPVPAFFPAPAPFPGRSVINVPESNGLFREHFLAVSQPPNYRLAAVAPNTATVTGAPGGGRFRSTHSTRISWACAARMRFATHRSRCPGR